MIINSLDSLYMDKKPKMTRAALERRDRKNRLVGFIAGIALTSAASGITGVTIAKNNANRDIFEFDAKGKTVEQASEYCGIDSRAILIANKGIENEGQAVYKITVPVEYDMYEKYNSEIDEKLKDDDLYYSDKLKLNDKKQELKEIKEKQEDMAQIYTDGKWAYIVPNDYFTVTEDLKEVLGIKDGIIIKNNKNQLNYKWGIDSDGHGYKDYTFSTVPYSGIKVPLKELGKELDIISD